MSRSCPGSRRVQKDTKKKLKTHAKISTSSRKKVVARAKKYNYAHYKLKPGSPL